MLLHITGKDIQGSDSQTAGGPKQYWQQCGLPVSGATRSSRDPAAELPSTTWSSQANKQEQGNCSARSAVLSPKLAGRGDGQASGFGEGAYYPLVKPERSEIRNDDND